MNSPWRNRIQIVFNELDIPCNNNDFIEYTSERYNGDPYRMCGRKAPPLILSTDGLWMTFVSGPNPSTNKGFSLRYEIASCNQTYATDSVAHKMATCMIATSLRYNAWV